MALICDIELDSGLTVKDAYIRIGNSSGNDKSLSFRLDAYVSIEAFTEEKTPIASFDYSIEFNKTRNLYNQAYEFLIGLPEYANSIEA